MAFFCALAIAALPVRVAVAYYTVALPIAGLTSGWVAPRFADPIAVADLAQVWVAAIAATADFLVFAACPVAAALLIRVAVAHYTVALPIAGLAFIRVAV
jgi:hypothetical protein